ncbi:MAG: trypsin-like peptidase domain-containing protein [Armatimonadetes bacterium]|nr:trypsin-like peptidase domain-containing protein [Armatimonadota bacterium]MDW8121281.1 trypsin-like peptidase domain-containing protein [Armatimonadota bacterium]
MNAVSLRDLIIWFTGLLVGGLLMATGYQLGRWSSERETIPTSQPASRPVSTEAERPTNGPITPQTMTPDFWVPIVEKVGPAVVNIDGGQERLPFPTNAGSGIIIDGKRGLVVTNHHVVEGARTITVTLKDGRSYKARLLGAEPQLDLAILKIDANGLPEARFGRSDELKEGAWVIAIGNPYGFSNTATVGIISAKGRSLPDDETFLNDLLQTDAAINPGNSGGALVNLKGEVVGLNVAMRPGAQGIAFAIPAEIVSDAVQQLLRHQEVRQPVIGIRYDMASAEELNQMGLSTPKALKVVSVMEGTPAEKAGLHAGDAIVQINGQPVRDVHHLRQVVRQSAQMGTPFQITVVRQGKTRSISIQPEWMPLSRFLNLSR